MPLRLLPPLMYSLIVYWWVLRERASAARHGYELWPRRRSTGLHDTVNALFWFNFILVVSNGIGAAMCLAVGALFPSTAVANLVATLLLLIAILFCGCACRVRVATAWSHCGVLRSFMINKALEAPLWIGVQATSFLSYGFEGLLVNEFVGQEFLFQPVDFSVSASLAGSVSARTHRGHRVAASLP